MGVRKWSEIKALSKATDADRAAARAELADELRQTRVDEVADEQRFQTLAQEAPVRTSTCEC